jgi:hypothetical protein
MEISAQYIKLADTGRNPRDDAIRSILSVSLWHDLARHISAYKPDVIVLVARKMPRIREALDIEFCPGAIEITDWAIPFSHSILNKSRVAIVDDVINRGSTVENASKHVMACGASDVRFFALAKTSHADLLNDKLQCARNTPLNEEELRDFAYRVPEALSLVNKPFDLGFPVIPCTFAIPFREYSDIREWLIRIFGPEAVHNPTTPLGYKHQFQRLSIDLGMGKPGICKIRLYIDERIQECNMVPFWIPPVLPVEGLVARTTEAKAVDALLMEALDNAPVDSMLWPDEARVRAYLFIAGLELGQKALELMQDIFVLRGPELFNETDARLAFGPAIKHASCLTIGKDHVSIPELKLTDEYTSPFLEKCKDFDNGQFMDKMRDAVPANLGPLSIEILFDELFTRLSKFVGAANYKDYSLSWPFTKNQISRNPYLRLRIGPTFDDLVHLMSGMLDSDLRLSEDSIRSAVGDLLDRFIDEGVVVPTITSYEGKFYRIYRKGENGHRDKAIQRALLSLDHLGRPISRTRLAKILTILTYSSQVETCLVPAAEGRGNVSVFTKEIFAEEAEITRYLIETGHIKKCQS